MSTLPVTCDLLSPFALCVNFPHALMERHFHDYFSDSLTLPLSRVRSILSSCKYLRLYVGAHFVISLSVRAGSNESLQRKYYRSPARWTQAIIPFLWASPCSAMTWIQPIKTSPYTASLTDLWLLGLELHQHFARHAIFPSVLSVEGVLVHLRGRVSRCVTHLALVSLPRRVRETFAFQRRTTMGVPSPCRMWFLFRRSRVFSRSRFDVLQVLRSLLLSS
jgi:hypothetical protein